MKSAAIGAAFLVVAASAASANESSNCTLRNLGACSSTNDLFWAPQKKSGRTTARREFSDALAAFLQGAPKLYLGKTGFTPAQIASNALVGPGDHHDRLPAGGWFFDGFTPHDAQERGAVIFSTDGSIRLVALLNVEADAVGRDPTAQDMSRYRLRLYSHGEPDAATIHLLENWAGFAVKSDNRKNPQGNEGLAGTQLVALKNARWQRLP